MSCCSHLWSRGIWQPHKRASLFYFSIYICTRESLYIIKRRDWWIGSTHACCSSTLGSNPTPPEIIIGRQKQRCGQQTLTRPPKIYQKPKKDIADLLYQVKKDSNKQPGK